jgi:hypothetical protein
MSLSLIRMLIENKKHDRQHGSALNYKIVASVLMMAKARRAQITIYNKHDTSGSNYFSIDYAATLD